MRLHKKVIVFIFGLLPAVLFAQQLKITEFLLFGGNGNCPTGVGQKAPLFPGCSVVIGNSADLKAGSIGSYRLVKATNSLNVNGSIYSGGTLQLGNNATILGKIAVSNTSKASGNIIDLGNKALISGNIDVAGNTNIGTNGSVKGKVTHPTGTTYTGPVPTGGNITGTPTLPLLPSMPSITNRSEERL
jgi:hypothetical protein